jgi:hypothetical protein
MVSPCYCVVCAVRLQFKILWQGYKKKFTVSPTGIPTEYNPSVFHRELQKNYRIVLLSPTAFPTGYCSSVFHRELQNNYGSVPQSPTDVPTDLRTSWSARMSDTCSSATIPTDFPTDQKLWWDFQTFLVRISINYRRKLMPPTTINFYR